MKNVIISIILAAVMLFGAVACTKAEAYELGAVDLRYADTLQIAEDCGITLRDDRVLDIETLENICDLARAMYSRYSSVTFEKYDANRQPVSTTVNTQNKISKNDIASLDSTPLNNQAVMAKEYVSYMFELKNIVRMLIKNYVKDEAYYAWQYTPGINMIWPDFAICDPQKAEYTDWNDFLESYRSDSTAMPDYIEVYDDWVSYHKTSTGEYITVFPNNEESAMLNKALEIEQAADAQYFAVK